MKTTKIILLLLVTIGSLYGFSAQDSQPWLYLQVSILIFGGLLSGFQFLVAILSSMIDKHLLGKQITFDVRASFIRLLSYCAAASFGSFVIGLI